VAIGNDTIGYRRYLPHLLRLGKTYFVTFCTKNREVLPAAARDLALQSCIHDHCRRCWIDIAVVMPDHIHVVATPYETTALHVIVQRIKSASAYKINRLLNRDYVAMNPVRAGLVERPEDYPWLWIAQAGREPATTHLRGRMLSS
jgi:REP element-mobilizing transposase RayT